ncbi:phosphate uptake regulator PhoU [Candidatus Woesearchaeota archaeon]|nr:phosphate uptake regulator PhoU [Candidatus Woesearchaeota archaeon]
MGRKVIKHGPSTLIVSLPSGWVKQQGIRKGDEIDCRQEGGQLIFTPKQTAHAQQVSLDVRRMEPFLVDRFLARSYQKGYDRILLTHHSLELLEVIRKKVTELIGFDIMEQNDKTCLIQSIADRINLDFDSSLRKVYLLLKAIIQDIRDAYQKRDYGQLSSLFLRDLEVNRLAYYCLRCINKAQLRESVPRYEQKLLYYLCERLEDLGDRLKHVARHLSLSKTLNKKIAALLGQLCAQYDLAYHYYYKPSVEAANASLHIYHKMKKQLDDILANPRSSSELWALFLITQAMGIIYHIVTMRLDAIQEGR